LALQHLMGRRWEIIQREVIHELWVVKENILVPHCLNFRITSIQRRSSIMLLQVELSLGSKINSLSSNPNNFLKPKSRQKLSNVRLDYFNAKTNIYIVCFLVQIWLVRVSNWNVIWNVIWLVVTSFGYILKITWSWHVRVSNI
jgi:hypothetical protein